MSEAVESKNSPYPTVILKPGEADRVVAGHPWVYEGSVMRITREAADGDWVQVKDHRQRFLGTGVWNSKSKIRVRVLSIDKEPADASFFRDRLLQARQTRQRLMPNASCYRWVNAESDFLSGLIIDQYEDCSVIQITSVGMERRKADIVSAMREIQNPHVIYERGDIASRRFEGLPETSKFLHGENPGLLTVKLNGLQFQVDLVAGHKTGIYLDQQVNYQAVADLVKPGDHVLDCFSFIGGFALHAARAGAAKVHALDQSEEATTALLRHAKLNGLEERVTAETINVFDWLKQHTQAPSHEKIIPRYDLIILDPPSFTRNRASVPDAMRGYKEIHLRAMKLLKPNGILATFCCSHHVDAPLFEEAIMAASYDAHRLLRRVRTFSQSPDHPIIPAIPETEYLKGFAYEMAR